MTTVIAADSATSSPASEPSVVAPRGSAAAQSDQERTRELLVRASQCQGAQRDALLTEVIESHLGLADALAKRYWRSGSDFDDLRQVARTGLVEAVQRFVPERGEFIGFAVPTITGVIKRHFRDHTWMVRPPRQTQELVSGVRKEWSRVAQEIQAEPSMRDLAGHLDQPMRSIREAQLAADCYRPASMATQDDHVACRSVQDDFDRSEIRLILSSSIRTLSEPERELIRMRFWEHMSQQEIASVLGTNQMSVSRRLRRLLAKLRDLVGSLDEYDDAEAISATARTSDQLRQLRHRQAG